MVVELVPQLDSLFFLCDKCRLTITPCTNSTMIFDAFKFPFLTENVEIGGVKPYRVLPHSGASVCYEKRNIKFLNEESYIGP